MTLCFKDHENLEEREIWESLELEIHFTCSSLPHKRVLKNLSTNILIRKALGKF